MPRTDLENIIFKNNKPEIISARKNPLYNVLYAYCMLDPELAYVQGMSFLAAMILNFFELKN